jgi:hypothetical protein
VCVEVFEREVIWGLHGGRVAKTSSDLFAVIAMAPASVCCEWTQWQSRLPMRLFEAIANVVEGEVSLRESKVLLRDLPGVT